MGILKRSITITLVLVAMATPVLGAGARTSVPGLKEGAGLRRIDAQAFELQQAPGSRDRVRAIAALSRRLPVVGIDEVMRHTNRQARRDRRRRVRHQHVGFRWNKGDERVRYWFPQGITSSADAVASGSVAGRKILLVSWYFKPDVAKSKVDKGVRISFCDITDPRNVRYRHVLLVDPYMKSGQPDFRPVSMHAGGIVWYGRWLYVADTRKGFRIFDMAKIMQVTTGDKSKSGRDRRGRYQGFNYRYILPQVASYQLTGASARSKFSFVSLDRSSYPHSLVTGEYHTKSIQGKVLRWPLNPRTGQLDTRAGRVSAMDAFVSSHHRMQGVLSWQGQFFIVASSQRWRWYSPVSWFQRLGALYRTADGRRSREYSWAYGPEDLTLDPHTSDMWHLTEWPRQRWVFAVKIDRYGG